LEARRKTLLASESPGAGEKPGPAIREIPRLWKKLSTEKKHQLASLLIAEARLSGETVELVWRYGFDRTEENGAEAVRQ
jgi:hypothetical protein